MADEDNHGVGFPKGLDVAVRDVLACAAAACHLWPHTLGNQSRVEVLKVERRGFDWASRSLRRESPHIALEQRTNPIRSDRLFAGSTGPRSNVAAPFSSEHRK
jgi:hypothetical protein